jgi:hypothetical protein
MHVNSPGIRKTFFPSFLSSSSPGKSSFTAKIFNLASSENVGVEGRKLSWEKGSAVFQFWAEEEPVVV